MVQHTLPGDEQSVSALQSCRPACAFWQLFCALGAKLVVAHAWPLAESHIVSDVQTCGQLIADWQTLPAAP
jgi:hypothetical protein